MTEQTYAHEVNMATATTHTANPLVLAFDTANEMIAIGVGRLCTDEQRIEPIATVEVAAHRASNTQLIPHIDALMNEHGLARDQIACVAVGRGPGSFTGVRIALATAKGIAQGLGVALVGVSSLDVVAWNAQAAGARGQLVVVADAMRKEVYPVRFELSDAGIVRKEADRVIKAEDAARELMQASIAPALLLAGDALVKYGELFAAYGRMLPEEVWTPSGRGLLLALQAAWQAGEADPFDVQRHNPAFALPVYTRLSDAEENERIRLAKNDPRNLVTGVQDVAVRRDQRASMHDTAILNVQPDEHGIVYKPLDAAHAAAVAALEQRVMGSDAWSESLVADELPRKDRSWWAAYVPADSANLVNRTYQTNSAQPAPVDGLVLVGYAGGWVVDGQVQILKVGVDPAWRRHGIARELLARVAADARDLGASVTSLEVRVSNAGAISFYETIGLHVLGTRPRYYSDHEDALIMEGPLPLVSHDVAGMQLRIDEARASAVRASDVPAAQSDPSVAAQSEPDTASAVATSAAVSASVPTAPTEGLHSVNVSRETFVDEIAYKNISRPLILAIESSCDETAAAIVDGEGNLVADVVASQIDFHARFGGVVPEIASRKHIEAICGVCDECFDVAAKHLGITRLTWHDLDSVAVTQAPGLLGALVVGVAFAKGAAWSCDLPLIGVHHLEGHLYANKIGAPDFAPPAVVSLVSGGNTLLVHMKDWGEYTTLGSTIDDAVGEAFDKVAKALGLGYPGGPVISREAARGHADAIAFPRAMMHSGDLRFSLSGLKTAVVTYINNERTAGRDLNIPDICASFQQAVVDVQIKKAQMALEQTGAPVFCLGGGVAANPVLRDAYEKLCARLGVRLVMPPLSACGDNAGMIALVALDRFAQHKFLAWDADARAHADLDEPY